MSENVVRSLWGQDFKIVRNGLAESEVVAFITKLIDQRDNLLKRQQHLDYLQRLAEKMVSEASDLATSIKQDAEDETTRMTEEAQAIGREVMGQAHGEAKNIVAEARKLAVEIKQEAENIISEAHNLATSIRNEAECEVSRMVEEAEAIASQATYDVLMEAENMARKKVNIILEKARQQAAAMIEVARERVASELQTVQDGTVLRLEHSASHHGTTKGRIRPVIPSGITKSELEALLPFMPDSETSNASTKETAQVKVSQQTRPVAVASATRTKEKATAVSSGKQPKTSPLSGEDAALFEGEVEIAIVPPVDTIQLSRLTRKLEDVSHVRILRTDGYWDEGYIITALIDDPLPVISLLKEMAEVEKTNLWTDGRKGSDGYFPGWVALNPKPGGIKGNRLVVKLRKDLHLSTAKPR